MMVFLLLCRVLNRCVYNRNRRLDVRVVNDLLMDLAKCKLCTHPIRKRCWRTQKYQRAHIYLYMVGGNCDC